MKAIFFYLSLFILFFRLTLADESSLTTLYRSLNPLSISELFAFYSLYPKTPEGKKALADAWKLLYKHNEETHEDPQALTLPKIEIEGLISLVNQHPFDTSTQLSNLELAAIEKASAHLSNRTLKGHFAWKNEEWIDLPSEDIDLGRALLLTQFEGDLSKVRHYEAMLDLIALQILAYLPKGASDLEKIERMNHFIFYEKGFRFPPHALWAKEIDTYTFLPLVLDSRLGVCLGVSILYLCIAERINLPLEIVTPPGHIFLRYRNGACSINIETTARGVDFPDEKYLGVDVPFLQNRAKKEVIGLALMNQAAVFWQKKEYPTTVALYEKALPFLPEDPLLKRLLAYNYLFIGKRRKGKTLLKQLKKASLDATRSRETTPEDYLNGKVNVKGIQTIFLQVDETRHSILKKQKKLKNVLKRFPHFREGLLQLALTHLQLGTKEGALNALNSYHAIDPTSPIVEYYLATLCTHRFLYEQAWTHLFQAELLTQTDHYTPTPLKQLRQTLKARYPDPQDSP